MRVKLLILCCLTLFAASISLAQSGKGYLKIYVKCGEVRNDGCVVSGAKVILRPIENWSKSTADVVSETDRDGYSSTAVSFGEYELIISAEGYDTYQTTVYIPSSKKLEWAVRLRKLIIPTPNFSDSEKPGNFSVGSDFNFYISQADQIYQLNKNQKLPLAEVAEAVTHYTNAVRENPFNSEAYRKRAAARYDLFLGANAFTISDLQTAIALDPNDAESKKKLAEYQEAYKKMHLSKECVSGRNLSAFEGNGTETRTQLTMDLDASDENYDPKPALKDIACGANVNYVYKRDHRSPQFGSVLNLKPEVIIAMLEAGANPNQADKFGNSVLMLTLKDFINDKESGLVNDEYLEKSLVGKKLGILISYGANLSGKNLKGETVALLVKKANDVGIDIVAGQKGSKFFDGTWFFESKQATFSLRLFEKDDGLTGEFAYFSAGKKLSGKILSSKVSGEKATLEIGGLGTVEIELINQKRLHWKVKTGGKLLVLQDEFLTKQ